MQASLTLIPGTEFSREDDRLSRLCGVALTGTALVKVNGVEALTFEQLDESPATVTCRWRVGALRLTTIWTGDAATGVVSRRDTLTNTSDTPAVVTRCLARFVLPAGAYECYTQSSRWCAENQGAWQPLHAGLRLTHLPGRTTEGATPYLAIRRDGEGLAFHILPRGNWTIRVTPVAQQGALPSAMVELGMADENLNLTLAAGETFALPEILCQALPQGEPHLAAPALHRYLLNHHFNDAKREAPVVYNTWFDQFQIIDVARLRRQLAAAKDAGCEIFVVDAGWYGGDALKWWEQAGDWHEKQGAAFHGRMREFADEARAAGLGFGLWMEPERIGPDAPLRREHPEWLIPAGNAARLDLTQPAARAWLRAEIGRLVETYRLAWMKLDFNFPLDTDATGAELARYFAVWYTLLDEVRAAYPQTFFEGCSSGAMRGDLETMRHHDGHFLSDSVNPTDMLRLSQGAWLRLPPGRITRWAVLRSVAGAVCDYGRTTADSQPIILVPGGALWNGVESVELDFALLAALPGMFGVSGDFASLTPAQLSRISEATTFYKKWRRFITGSVAHLLTPPQPLESRHGWVAVQLQSPDNDTSLVFTYRLDTASTPPALRLRGLDPRRQYRVCRGFQEKLDDSTMTADSLLPVGNDRASVCVVG